MPAETSVAIIGLGSRGLSVLERLLTLAARHPEAAPVRIEIIDPTASGAGVHDRNQPDYLLLNTICSQVSMFPDAHSVAEAVGAPGPSLYEWALERDLRIADDGFTVGPVGRQIRPTDFLPRRVLGDYLAWFFQLLLERAPDQARITVHSREAVDLNSEPDGSLRCTLADGRELVTDYAFLTTGYTGNLVTGAAADQLISEPYPMPDRWARVGAGQSVAISGFGLSAMDAMSSLTVGRGGRFDYHGARLHYRPSGDEPRLLLYSRTGIPCRARPRVLEFGPRYRPVVFTHSNLGALRAERGPLDFEAEIWPLIVDELRVAYRRCQARQLGPDAERELGRRLVAAEDAGQVTALLDSLDTELGAFDPYQLLDGGRAMCLQDSESYQRWLISTICADLAEGERGLAGSVVKATLDILRDLRDTFRYAIDFGGLTAVSLDRFMASTVPLLNRAVVGPQFERHAELVALQEAGVLATPFGPDPSIEWDADAGRWTLSSRQLAAPYSTQVDWLATGWVGLPSVSRSTSPLLDSLYRKGYIRPHSVGSRQVVGIDIDRDQHPIDAQGRVEARIWVLGPLCEGATFYNNLVPSPGTYSRPIYDAHRCAVAMFAADRTLVPMV